LQVQAAAELLDQAAASGGLNGRAAQAVREVGRLLLFIIIIVIVVIFTLPAQAGLWAA
jgi:hypothetical protein